jgi:FkbM family methyltransferase
VVALLNNAQEGRKAMALLRLPSTLRICGHTFIPGFLSAESRVVDLGLNEGRFARAILNRFRCRVYGAEPSPSLLSQIEPHESLKILPVAIGAKSGTATLTQYSDTCSSLVIMPEARRHGEVTVSTMTFRDFLDHFAIGTIDLLKVDIEGAELDMFASTPDETWRRCRQITIEFHDFLLPETRHAVERAARRLVALGFYRINMSRDNSDVLFVNRESTDVSITGYLYLKYVVKYARGLRRVLARTAFPSLHV